MFGITLKYTFTFESESKLRFVAVANALHKKESWKDKF